MSKVKHTHRVTIETTLFGSTEDPIDFNCRSAAEARRKRALLAAAPEMLEALQWIVNLQDAGWSKEVLELKIRETAIKAIAKATGGAE